MIGQHSVDRHTNTVEDAATFERLRGGSYGDADVDLPGPHDLIDDERDAERQRQRDAEARARGEYVPSTAMRLTATIGGFALTTRGVFGMAVEPAREGILRVTPDRGSGLTPAAPAKVVEALTAFYGDDAEVALGDGVIWVRILRTPNADPFVVDGVAQDEPPF